MRATFSMLLPFALVFAVTACDSPPVLAPVESAPQPVAEPTAQEPDVPVPEPTSEPPRASAPGEDGTSPEAELLPPSEPPSPDSEATPVGEGTSAMPAADVPSDPSTPAPEILAAARPGPPSSDDALFLIGESTIVLPWVAQRYLRLWQLGVEQGVEVRTAPTLDWSLTVQSTRARADALASILGVTATPAGSPPSIVLEPRVLRARESTGVRLWRPDGANATTIARGTIVLGLLGQVRAMGDNLISSLAPDGDVLVVDIDESGWVPVERLEPYESCLPSIAHFTSDAERRSPTMGSSMTLLAERGGAPTRVLVRFTANYMDAVGVFDVASIEGRVCRLSEAPIVRDTRDDLQLCRAEVVRTTPPLLATEWDRFCVGDFDYQRYDGLRTQRVYVVGTTEPALELVLPTHPALGPRRRTQLRWNVRAGSTAPPLEVRPAGGEPQAYVLEEGRLVPVPAAEALEGAVVEQPTASTSD